MIILQSPGTLVRQSAILALAPGLLLVWVYLSDNRTDPGLYDGYWTAVLAQSAILLVFSSVVGAASAAFETGRLRRGQILSLPRARSAGTVLLRVIWPSLISACIVQGYGTFLIVRQTLGSPGEFPFLLVLAIFSIILAFTLLGAWLGLVMPAAFALPLSIVLTYVLLGFPWSFEYAPVRYLVGLALSDCCSPGSTLAAGAVAATITFGSIFATAIAILLLVSTQRSVLQRALGAILALLLITSGVVAALYLARDVGPSPAVARDAGELVCQRTHQVEVCLYPEQQFANPQAREILSLAVDSLKASGVPVPSTVTAGSAEPRNGDRVSILVRMDATPDMLIHSLVATLTERDNYSDCGHGTEYTAELDQAQATVVLWYTRTAAAGVPGASGQPLATSDLRGDESLFGLSPQEQVAWVELNIRALRSCSATATPVPIA